MIIHKILCSLQIAAAWGITQVCISRIFIASPSMRKDICYIIQCCIAILIHSICFYLVIVPVIMHKLEKSAFIRVSLKTA